MERGIDNTFWLFVFAERRRSLPSKSPKFRFFFRIFFVVKLLIGDGVVHPG